MRAMAREQIALWMSKCHRAFSSIPPVTNSTKAMAAMLVFHCSKQEYN
jgi:hypothetical protein